VNKRSKDILSVRHVLEALADARRNDPSNIDVAIEFNQAVLVTRDLFQNMRSIVLDSIIDAFETPDPYPVNLWVEE